MIYMMIIGVILLTIGCSGIIFLNGEDENEGD